MRKESKRAQGLTEVSIIFVLVGIVALLLMIPYGQKISGFIFNSSAGKNSEASLLASVSKIFGADSALFIKNLNILKNSADTQAKQVGQSVMNVVNDLTKIQSGDGSKLSDQDFFKILTEFAKQSNGTSSETSGTLASLTNLNNSALSGNYSSAAQILEDILNKKSVHLDLNTKLGGSTLTDMANSLSGSLEQQILSGAISRSSLVYNGSNYTYNGSPVTLDQINKLSATDFQKFFDQNFNIGSASKDKIDNFVNMMMAMGNYGSNLPADLAAKYDQLKAATKASLELDPNNPLTQDSNTQPCPSYPAPKTGCHIDYTTDINGCLIAGTQTCSGDTGSGDSGGTNPGGSTVCPTYPPAKPDCRYEMTKDINGCMVPKNLVCDGTTDPGTGGTDPVVCETYPPAKPGCRYQMSKDANGCLVPISTICDGDTAVNPGTPTAPEGCHYVSTCTPTQYTSCADVMPKLVCDDSTSTGGTSLPVLCPTYPPSKTGCTIQYAKDSNGCMIPVKQTCTDSGSISPSTGGTIGGTTTNPPPGCSYVSTCTPTQYNDCADVMPKLICDY